MRGWEASIGRAANSGYSWTLSSMRYPFVVRFLFSGCRASVASVRKLFHQPSTPKTPQVPVEILVLVNFHSTYSVFLRIPINTRVNRKSRSEKNYPPLHLHPPCVSILRPRLLHVPGMVRPLHPATAADLRSKCYKVEGHPQTARCTLFQRPCFALAASAAGVLLLLVARAATSSRNEAVPEVFSNLRRVLSTRATSVIHSGGGLPQYSRTHSGVSACNPSSAQYALLAPKYDLAVQDDPRDALFHTACAHSYVCLAKSGAHAVSRCALGNNDIEFDEGGCAEALAFYPPASLRKECLMELRNGFSARQALAGQVPTRLKAGMDSRGERSCWYTPKGNIGGTVPFTEKCAASIKYCAQHCSESSLRSGLEQPTAAARMSGMWQMVHCRYCIALGFYPDHGPRAGATSAHDTFHNN
jgi:hypothetical protein